MALVPCTLAFWRRGATALLASPLTACSFLFVDAPPAHSQWRSPQSYVSCTTSKAAPVIDTVVTGLQVARTALAAGASDADYENAPISRQADMGFGLAFSALFGASAIYGYVTTGKCKDLRAGQGACPGGQACAAGPMAWQPCQCDQAETPGGEATPN